MIYLSPSDAVPVKRQYHEAKKSLAQTAALTPLQGSVIPAPLVEQRVRDNKFHSLS